MAIKLKPDLAEAYTNRGAAYGVKDEVARAIIDFTKAIELNPDDADTYYNRGTVYHNKGDYGLAIADFNTAIKLKPDLADAYTNRGNAYRNKDEVNRAIADYNMAIKLKPDLAEAYTNRGNAYSDKGDYGLAIADFNTAIKLDPHDAIAYYSRGGAYGNKGDYGRAIVDFNTAVQLKPDFTEAYNNRGVAYYAKGDYGHAIADFNTVIKMNPDLADAYTNRGNVYRNKNEVNRAIEDFNKAIELNPSDANAYYNRGEAWLHLEEWDKARTALTVARDMGIDIIASFHNDYKSVEAYERRNRVKLPGDIAAMLTPQVIAMKNKEARETTHELVSDAEIGLDEFLENYARVWKSLVQVPQPEGSAVHADLGDLAPKDIEKTLQKVRAEAEEERRLDPELDAIPETAYEDVDRFLKTINEFVPRPEIMPLDNGEICLEWREGQKIFTLSFGGDGHIVFAGIFGARNQARGILTFSMPHLIAVIGMITGLYLHYDN